MPESPRTAPHTSDPSDPTLVRRLDWRFLLPEPRLESVVFAGPAQSGLLAALHHAGESVVRAEASGSVSPEEESQCPVAVVQGAERERVETAHPHLARGGWLYWETRWSGARPAVGASRGATLRQARTSEDVRVVLRSLGYERIALHWHYPDFETCRWMVPLDDPAAGAWFLSRDRGRFPTALLRRIGSGVGSVPFLPRLACVSAVARRAAAVVGGRR